MPSTNGHYDHTLLASAPVATKKQIQEGYTTDILTPMRKPEPAPAGAASDPELAVPRSGSRPPTATLEDSDFYPEKKKPFWRTTKGIVIIALVTIVILGAIIGGAVGGTVGKNKDSSPAGAQDNAPVPSDSAPLSLPTDAPAGPKTDDPVPPAQSPPVGPAGPPSQGPETEQPGRGDQGDQIEHARPIEDFSRDGHYKNPGVRH